MRKLWAILLAAALTAGLLYGGRYLLEHYVFWNGTLLPRQAQELTISGRSIRDPEIFREFPDLRLLDAREASMTPDQYEWFRRELPDCEILWMVPIQGSGYSPDTAQLQVNALTEADMGALQYLPDLVQIDLGKWQDYAMIRQLQTAFPGLDLRYRICLCGEWWDCDAVSLVVRDADPAELAEKLKLFENLQSVMLTGAIPAFPQMDDLQDQYPQILFLWKLKALGQELETDMETMDLPDGALHSPSELEELLPYFPNLKAIRLSSLGLPQKELVALATAFPSIHFQFDLTFGDLTLSTDAEEIDLSNIPLENTDALEAILPCFHNLKKVVMCNCGIPDETMDALNRKYEDIRFVWSVDLAGMLFRTDSIHFTPNRWGLKCTDENIAALRYCTDMVCVDIGHAMEVTDCGWAANMPNLKYLILAETGITDISPLAGLENLIYLELFLCRIKDYTPLTTCRALRDLNLCYSYGDPTPIGEMTWLERLWWAGCWAARVSLPEKLTSTQMDFGSGSSTGRGWRDGDLYFEMRDFIGMHYMTG